MRFSLKAFHLHLKLVETSCILVSDTHLPIYLFDLQAVSIGNRLLAIGGSTIEHSSSLDIYEFICQTGRSCTWEKLQSQLKIPRVGFAAMPIPKPLITCN